MFRSHDRPQGAFSELLRYVNFGAVAACRVFECESYAI